MNELIGGFGQLRRADLAGSEADLIRDFQAKA